ncbi:IS66 family insertion sequence element accessory protein TnpA [Paenibacillus periandrae]|uniref:IS66 family insertion sequence element accessory protein TnpA n=1 Tax=Paenibacillus periandrae TaxID=1761741 RepID=UPI001F095223|nr:hypothetical protein [Paenibacillus periandrae]
MNTATITKQYRLNKWIEIVRECRSSGQTVSAWCAQNHINLKSYYYWLKRVREAACETLPALQPQNLPIVPVDFSASPTVQNFPESSHTTSEILIHMGAVTLEIRNHASATLIEHTLRALQHVR